MSVIDDLYLGRSYVSLHQKKDPKMCSLQIFCRQQQYHEHHDNWAPLSVAKYQRWNCANCLRRLKNSWHRTTSETVSMQQDGTNDDCSISIIRALPSVSFRRWFSCTQQSSQGNDADQSTVSKSVQEGYLKCSSPSDNKAVAAVNVPASTENNVPDTFVEKSVPATSAENNAPDTFVETNVIATKDLQGSPDNLDVPENIVDGISMDVIGLPDVPQMISGKEGNGTQSPCSPKPCEVPTEDENRTVQDVPVVDRDESAVSKPISGYRGSKQFSGHKSNQVRNQGPRRPAPKRNVGSDCMKKSNKSTDLTDISDPKFSQRKPKKTRLISELIDIQIGVSADAIEADHTKSGDICQSDKSKMALDSGIDKDTPANNQKVCAIQSTAVSLGKRKFQTVSGLPKQNISKNKKKRRVEVHEKKTVIDDIPMDIVVFLARNQHERQLMTDKDSLENNHTQPKTAAVDRAEIAAKDGPIDASAVLDTDFQKSLASGSKQKSLQDRASSSIEDGSVHLQDLHTQKSSQCHAESSTEIPNSHRSESHSQNSLQVRALSITGSFNVCPPKLRIPDILECTQEQQTNLCRDEEVTIACASPIFSHHQHIAEVPTQSWSNKGKKKLMWDSFKTASRNSPTPTYGLQFRNINREVDSTQVPVYGASNDYATHQPVIAAVDQYTDVAVNHVQPRSLPSTTLTMEVQQRSLPSTALTMEVGSRPYDQRIAGQSGLYPKEPMPATHLLRLMDSSTA